MKVRVLHRFHDKADYMRVYLVGDTLIFDDARAEYLIGLGLVEAVEKPVEAAKAVEEELVAIEKPVKPVAARRRNATKEN